MAYVQAYLDDNPVTQGLAKLQGKVKKFQATLSTMAAGTMGGELPEPFGAIARFAQSPAGAFAALLGAAKFTADARAEMLRMSETAGVTVEKFSAYAYAARRAGLSNEALASGLKKLESKEFQTAMQGLGKSIGGMKGLTSATFAAMGTGDATDRLRQFIKISENMPTAEKIGLAKRLGISELLPLINQGVESLDAFTARAKALGLVMSEEDARGGRKFAEAFGDLQDVLKSAVGQIGGAVVPLITGLTNVIIPVVAGIRDWIKTHKYLTVALFLGTGAIVAGGIALKGLAVITGIASKAITVLQWAVKGVQVAFSVLSSVISWLPLLANPWVLAGLAIAGVVIWIAKLAGSFDGLSALWKGLSQDFADSFGAIANALSKGDIQGAWNVVTAFLKTEWVRVTEYLAQAWANFSDYFMGMLDKYAPWVSTVLRAIGKAWDWICDHWGEGVKWFTGAWNTLCGFLEKTFGATGKFIIGLWDKILDKIAEAEYKRGGAGAHKAYMPKEDDVRKLLMMPKSDLNQSGGLTLEEANKRIAEMKAKGVQFDHHAEDLPFDARKEREKDARDLAAKEKAEFEERKKHRAMEADARLQAAHLELKKAIDAANAPGPADAKKKAAEDGLSANQQSAVAGTFSGAVAAMMGGGGNQAINLAQKQVDQGYESIELQRKHIQLMEEQRDKLRTIDTNMAKAAEMTSGVV
jgi:hypothetical protein